ncbi:hypothetical protein QBC43DRAFT_304567 [Cladorrhinum sp. PSN259]|nr:hypothetical protein QBC43DRAFT_304567 [Cladorrhinum sp. PSN259]
MASVSQPPPSPEEILQVQAFELKMKHANHLGAFLSDTPLTVRHGLAHHHDSSDSERYVKWIRIHWSVNGAFRLVQIRLDSGALGINANFVTRAMVTEHSFKVATVEPQTFDGAMGEKMALSEAVEVFWRGNDDKTRITQCFVLPESSKIKLPIFGQDFMNEYSSFLFQDKPAGQLQYLAQSKKDKLELAEITAARREQEAQDVLEAQRREAFERERRERQQNGAREGRSISLRKSNMGRKRKD